MDLSAQPSRQAASTPSSSLPRGAVDESPKANENTLFNPNQGSNDNIMTELAAVEPSNMQTQNDISIIAQKDRLPTPTSAVTPPSTATNDPAVSNAGSSHATDPNTSGSLSTGMLIAITVSMVVLAVLGVAMVLYVRRRRELQQLTASRRLQTRTTSNMNTHNNLRRSPPLRSSSLVRRNPSPLKNDHHALNNVGGTESTVAQSEMTVESSAFTVSTSQAGAEAWGIPPQVPANWPAHLPRPAVAPHPSIASEDDHHLQSVSARQLESQDDYTHNRDSSVKRSLSVHNQIDRSNTTDMRSSFSNDNDMWERSSIWSEDDPEQIRPPRKSLAALCNPATAAAAAGVIYNHTATTANSSWQTQPTASQNTTTHTMDEDIYSYNDGPYTLSDDDGPLSDKLNELITAEQRTRNQRSLLADQRRESTTLGTALMATLSPVFPIRSPSIADNLVLAQTSSGTNDNPELDGILNVSRDTLRDTTPQTPMTTLPPLPTESLPVPHTKALSMPLPETETGIAAATTTSVSEPRLAMPRPQSINSLDAQKLMEKLAIEEANQQQLQQQQQQQASTTEDYYGDTTCDSNITMTTSYTYDSSRPVSDAYLSGISHAATARGVNTARRINIATATMSKMDMNTNIDAMYQMDVQTIAQHVPLPDTPEGQSPEPSTN